MVNVKIRIYNIKQHLFTISRGQISAHHSFVQTERRIRSVIHRYHMLNILCVCIQASNRSMKAMFMFQSLLIYLSSVRIAELIKRIKKCVNRKHLKLFPISIRLKKHFVFFLLSSRTLRKLRSYTHWDSGRKKRRGENSFRVQGHSHIWERASAPNALSFPDLL